MFQNLQIRKKTFTFCVFLIKFDGKTRKWNSFRLISDFLSKLCRILSSFIDFYVYFFNLTLQFFLTFPADFYIPIFFCIWIIIFLFFETSENYRNKLKKHSVKYHKLFRPFTVRINCSVSSNILKTLGFQPQISKVFLDP